MARSRAAEAGRSSTERHSIDGRSASSRCAMGEGVHGRAAAAGPAGAGGRGPPVVAQLEHAGDPELTHPRHVGVEEAGQVAEARHDDLVEPVGRRPEQLRAALFESSVLYAKRVAAASSATRWAVMSTEVDTTLTGRSIPVSRRRVVTLSQRVGCPGRANPMTLPRAATRPCAA